MEIFTVDKGKESWKNEAEDELQRFENKESSYG
jgi:hypothetical protein